MSAAPWSRRANWSGDPPISRLMNRALAQPDLVSLAAGFVDDLTLPVEATRAAAQALLADPVAARQALQYGSTQGFVPLREAVLDQFLAEDRLTREQTGLTAGDVLITAGSNELLHLLADTLLDPGDIVLCTSPTYLVFLGLVASLGATAVGVRMDHGGLVPEALEAELARLDTAGLLSRVKALYLVTYFDNPTGVSLAAERRPEVLEVIRRWRDRQPIYILEDLAYRQLRYAGDDLPSLRSWDPRGEIVLVTQTFSKCFSPGIRVGYGILPPDVMAAVCRQKGHIDFGSPHFSQCLLEQVLRQGALAGHVAELRRTYQAKLAAMLKALERHLGAVPGVRWSRPQGGLYVWLELPECLDAGGRLVDLALEEGTLYVPGEYCYPGVGEPAARNRIRLSFGVQSPEGIERGIAMLGRAVRRALAEPDGP